MPSTPFRFQVENFLSVPRADWPIPVGLSALTGPSGSGKSRLLMAPMIASILLRWREVGDEEKQKIRWALPGIAPIDWSSWAQTGKSVTFGVAFGEVHATMKVHADPHENQWGVRGSNFIDLQHRVEDFPAVAHAVYYRNHDPAVVRRWARPDPSEGLRADGENVWPLLRSWCDRRHTRARYDFVVNAMRTLFGSEGFEDIDFSCDFENREISATIHTSGRSAPMAASSLSDGCAVALLHLMAAVSAKDGAIVALDNFEHYLHPAILRMLCDILDARAKEHGLRVVLGTHSPIVLDHFRGTRERVFVTERVEGHPFPICLADHPNMEWLSHFSIGDAYAAEEFRRGIRRPRAHDLRPRSHAPPPVVRSAHGTPPLRLHPPERSSVRRTPARVWAARVRAHRNGRRNDGLPARRGRLRGARERRPVGGSGRRPRAEIPPCARPGVALPAR